MMNIDVNSAYRVQQIQEAGRHVLGHYDKPGGWQPGGFTASLIGTFEKADQMNFERLRQAFPTLAHALTLMRDEGEGAVRRWAGIA